MTIKINITAGTNPIEGITQGLYTITLDGPAPVGGLTVNYGLAGTATNLVDYTLMAGTNITAVTGSSFTIAAGQTTATLLVNAINDGLADPNETVRLTIAAGTGYTILPSLTPLGAVSVGGSPISVAVGDFNGDGHLDLITANSSGTTASLRLGDGLGGGRAIPSYLRARLPDLWRWVTSMAMATLILLRLMVAVSLISLIVLPYV